MTHDTCEFASRLVGVCLGALVALSPAQADERAQGAQDGPDCIAILAGQVDPPLCVVGRSEDVTSDDPDPNHQFRVQASWYVVALDGSPVPDGIEVPVLVQCAESESDWWCPDRSGVISLATYYDGQIGHLATLPKGYWFSFMLVGTDRPEAVTIRYEWPDALPVEGNDAVADQSDGQLECLSILAGSVEPSLCIVSAHVTYDPEDDDIADAIWVLASLDGTPVREGIEVPVHARLSYEDGSPVGRGEMTYAGSMTQKGRSGMPAGQGLLVFHWDEWPDYQVIVTPVGADGAGATLTIEIDPPDDAAEPVAELVADLVAWFVGSDSTPLAAPLPPTGLTVSDD